MNTILAVIFVLVMIILSTAGRELERDWQTYFDRGIEVQDSIWQEIQRINNEWELIRYEGDIGIDCGDSVMVKKK